MSSANSILVNSDIQDLNEIWKPIPGTNEEYGISNLGRIKRLKISTARRSYPAGLILKPRIQKHGYAAVHIRINGRLKNYYIHDLVAVNFIGPIPQYCEINHINRNRSDNCVSNLEYLTRSANNTHSYECDSQMWITSHVKNAMSDEKVREILHLHQIGFSCRNISWQFNCSNKVIERIVARKTYRHVI